MESFENAGNVVLLVDDNADIRAFYGELLTQNGFFVHLAKSGFEALQILELEKDRIGAVVIDYSLPLMDGRETAELMHQLAPRIPRVLMTGELEFLHGKEWLSTLFVAALQKPYDSNAFVALLHKLLNRDCTHVFPGMENEQVFADRFAC